MAPDDVDPQRSLALSAASGDRRALDRLVAESFDYAYAVCRRIVGDHEDGLDATQDALISVVRGISSFDGRAKYTTWLYRIATNAALMQLRGRRRRPQGVEFALDPPAPGSGPAEQVATRLQVDAALRALPDEYRIVVVLREFEDLEYGEIADVLDLPIGTVRSRLNRARQLLLTMLRNSDQADGIEPS